MVAFPMVGAQAALLGAQQFLNDSRKVGDAIAGLGDKSRNMASVSNAAWTTAAGSAVAAASTISAAVAAVKLAFDTVAVAGTKFAADYEKGMNTVQVIGEATAQEMRDLSPVVDQLNAKFGTGMAGIATAAEELAKGGVAVKDQTEGALKAVIELSRASAGELGLQQAAILVANGLNAWSLAGSEAERVTNSVTAAAQKSTITYNDLRRSFQQSSAVAAAMGYTVEETASVIGVMGQAGLRGSDAGTSLKQMFLSLMAPTKKATEIMRTYGLNLYDAQGKALPFRDILVQLEAAFGEEAIATGKVSEAQRNYALATIFGSDAIRAALVNVLKGTDAYDQMRAAVDRMSASMIASRQLDTASAKWEIFTKNVQAAMIKLGDGFLPLWKSFLEQMTAFTQGVSPGLLQMPGRIVESLIRNDSFSAIFGDLNKMLGPDVAKVAEAFINVIRGIRVAFETELGPAFANLKAAFTDTFNQAGGAQALAQAIHPGLTSAILTAISFVSNLINLGADLVRNFRENATAMAIWETVIKGLIALPILGFVAVFGGIALAVGKTVTVFFAFGAALNVLGPIVRTLGTGISNLFGWLSQNAPTAIGIATAAFAGLAYMIGVDVVTALGTFWAANGATITAFALQKAAVLGAAAAWVFARVSAVGAFLPVLGQFLVVAGMTIATWGFLGVAAVAYAVTHIPQVIVATGGMIKQFGLLIATQTLAAASAVKTAAISAAAWVMTMLPAAITAITGILAAAAPFLAGLAAIALAVFAVKTAWENNWGDIQGITGRILGWAGDRIADFINWLKGVPIIGGFIDSIVQGFGSLKGAVENGALSVKSFIDQAGQFDIQKLIDQITKGDGALDMFALRNQVTAEDIHDMQGPLSVYAERFRDLKPEIEANTNELYDFGDASEEAAKKFKQAMESLEDAAATALKGIDKNLRDTQYKLIKLGESVGDKINEAIIDAADDIRKAQEETDKRVAESIEEHALNHAIDLRRELLDTALELEERMRDRQLEVAEYFFQKEIDLARRAREKERDDSLELFKAAQEAQADQFEKYWNDRLDKLRDSQDAEEEALKNKLSDEKRAWSRRREDDKLNADEHEDLAKAKAELDADLAWITTERERQLAIEAYNEKVAKIKAEYEEKRKAREQDRREQDEERAYDLEQERQLAELKAKHEAELKAERERQAEAERKFREEQARLLKEYERKLDEQKRAEEEQANRKAMARRWALADEDRTYQLGQEAQRRQLDDQLDDEALQRTIVRLQRERDERIDNINKALAEKQAKIREQAATEERELLEHLQAQLDDIQENFINKLPDILEKGGDAIRPAIIDFTSIIVDAMNDVTAAANAAAAAVARAVGVAPPAVRNTPRPPKSYATGGIVPGYGPQLAVVHGGERFLGVGNNIPTSTEKALDKLATMWTRSVITQSTPMLSVRANALAGRQQSITYHVDAHYSAVQSKADVAMDMEALVMLTRR
jgi:TP901 family phage tail tape measure protein